MSWHVVESDAANQCFNGGNKSLNSQQNTWCKRNLEAIPLCRMVFLAYKILCTDCVYNYFRRLIATVMPQVHPGHIPFCTCEGMSRWGFSFYGAALWQPLPGLRGVGVLVTEWLNAAATAERKRRAESSEGWGGWLSLPPPHSGLAHHRTKSALPTVPFPKSCFVHR